MGIAHRIHLGPHGRVEVLLGLGPARVGLRDALRARAAAGADRARGAVPHREGLARAALLAARQVREDLFGPPRPLVEEVGLVGHGAQTGGAHEVGAEVAHQELEGGPLLQEQRPVLGLAPGPPDHLQQRARDGLQQDLDVRPMEEDVVAREAVQAIAELRPGTPDQAPRGTPRPAQQLDDALAVHGGCPHRAEQPLDAAVGHVGDGHLEDGATRVRRRRSGGRIEHDAGVSRRRRGRPRSPGQEGLEEAVVELVDLGDGAVGPRRERRDGGALVAGDEVGDETKPRLGGLDRGEHVGI